MDLLAGLREAAEPGDALAWPASPGALPSESLLEHLDILLQQRFGDVRGCDVRVVAALGRGESHFIHWEEA